MTEPEAVHRKYSNQLAFFIVFNKWVFEIGIFQSSDGHALRADGSEHHPTGSPAEVEPPSFHGWQLCADPHTQSR